MRTPSGPSDNKDKTSAELHLISSGMDFSNTKPQFEEHLKAGRTREALHVLGEILSRQSEFVAENFSKSDEFDKGLEKLRTKLKDKEYCKSKGIRGDVIERIQDNEEQLKANTLKLRRLYAQVMKNPTSKQIEGLRDALYRNSQYLDGACTVRGNIRDGEYGELSASNSGYATSIQEGEKAKTAQAKLQEEVTKAKRPKAAQLRGEAPINVAKVERVLGIKAVPSSKAQLQATVEPKGQSKAPAEEKPGLWKRIKVSLGLASSAAGTAKAQKPPVKEDAQARERHELQDAQKTKNKKGLGAMKTKEDHRTKSSYWKRTVLQRSSAGKNKGEVHR